MSALAAVYGDILRYRELFANLWRRDVQARYRGSVAVESGFLRRPPSALAPYAPGGGRNPGFEHPLLCPAVVREVEPRWVEPIEGLPALEPPPDEPWLYDGSIEVTARLRSGRRRG